MNRYLLPLALACALVGTPAARADCESDMTQLEAALKAPKLSADAKAALDDASAKSVAAMKKDDDATCHKVIGEAMGKVGMKLN